MANAAFNFNLHRRRMQKALQPIIRNIVMEVTEDFVNNRLIRCSSCGHLYPFAVCSIASCSVCVFVTGRCLDCGGEDGILRSLRAHFRALSWKNSREKFGDSHFDAISKLKKYSKENVKYLRLVSDHKRPGTK